MIFPFSLVLGLSPPAMTMRFHDMGGNAVSADAGRKEQTVPCWKLHLPLTQKLGLKDEQLKACHTAINLG